MAKQPAVTPHGDPNVMVSPISAFVRTHLFAEISAVAVYFIVEIMISGLELGLWVDVALGIACTILWLVFDFYGTLNSAMRDRNLVKYNYIQYDKWKGLKSGLYAQVPGLVVIVIIWITNSSPSQLNSWARLIYFILYGPTIAATAALEQIHTAFLLFPLWICPVISALAYHLGYNEVPFLTNIVYKNRARNKKLR